MAVSQVKPWERRFALRPVTCSHLAIISSRVFLTSANFGGAASGAGLSSAPRTRARFGDSRVVWVNCMGASFRVRDLSGAITRSCGIDHPRVHRWIEVPRGAGDDFGTWENDAGGYHFHQPM